MALFSSRLQISLGVSSLQHPLFTHTETNAQHELCRAAPRGCTLARRGSQELAGLLASCLLVNLVDSGGYHLPVDTVMDNCFDLSIGQPGIF